MQPGVLAQGERDEGDENSVDGGAETACCGCGGAAEGHTGRLRGVIRGEEAARDSGARLSRIDESSDVVAA